MPLTWSLQIAFALWGVADALAGIFWQRDLGGGLLSTVILTAWVLQSRWQVRIRVRPRRR